MPCNFSELLVHDYNQSCTVCMIISLHDDVFWWVQLLTFGEESNNTNVNVHVYSLDIPMN